MIFRLWGNHTDLIEILQDLLIGLPSLLDRSIFLALIVFLVVFVIIFLIVLVRLILVFLDGCGRAWIA